VMTLEMSQRPSGARMQADLIVDCDVHNAIAAADLAPRLPVRWREFREQYGGRDHNYASILPRMHPSAARSDSWPPSGRPPGGDLDFMREQLLDEWNMACAVLFAFVGSGDPNVEFVAARSRAENDVMVEEWFAREPRLRGSMNIAWEDAAAAVAEIHRVGHDRGFVQVAGCVRAPSLLGNRRYWPIYDAATELGLPIALHFGGWSPGPPTGSGRHTFYSEEKGGIASIAQDQVTSLVCEGVFERIPCLRIVLIENGFAWLPALMWRLDRAWKRLKAEVPILSRLPSEYIREHIWTTTQPIDEPPVDAQFLGLLEQMDMDDHIMFATDYPHWDFDAPNRAIPGCVPPTVRTKIMGENANRLYRLGL
jgi:uncharacterized protein